MLSLWAFLPNQRHFTTPIGTTFPPHKLSCRSRVGKQKSNSSGQQDKVRYNAGSIEPGPLTQCNEGGHFRVLLFGKHSPFRDIWA